MLSSLLPSCLFKAERELFNFLKITLRYKQCSAVLNDVLPLDKIQLTRRDTGCAEFMPNMRILYQLSAIMVCRVAALRTK
jgi:hypothetical protein